MSTKNSPRFKPPRMPRIPAEQPPADKRAAAPEVSEFVIADEADSRFDPYNTATAFVAPRDRKS